MTEAAPIPNHPAIEVQLRVIPREQHCISRKNISAAALRVLYRLNEAGFAAHLVGGAVRDLLLGGRPKDFDVATNATPEDVKRLFRNCRLIGRRFRLAHVVFGNEIVEVATFRGSSDDGSGDRHVVDGRIVRDNVYGTHRGRRGAPRLHGQRAVLRHRGFFGARLRRRLCGPGAARTAPDRRSAAALSRRSGAHVACGAPRRQARFQHCAGSARAVRGTGRIAAAGAAGDDCSTNR